MTVQRPDSSRTREHLGPGAYTFERSREKQARPPWVCVAMDCDEALPDDEPGRSCPRCGSDMIRSPYSRIVTREAPDA